MRILKPNIGKEIVPILKSDIYVVITDYGLKSLLREIKISPGQHHWCWIDLKVGNIIDISGTESKYCSFDNAINRMVNDAYSTIYEFEDYDDMVNNWKEIKYVETIETIYKSD